MEDQLAQSIDRRLKWLFWLLLPGAFVCVVVAVGLLIMLCHGHCAPEPATVAKVVVARMDLAVGDELTRTNLELQSLPEAQWPEPA